MKESVVTVFPETKLGTIKKLNGGNLAPAITAEKAGGNIRREFQALNIPITRLHDASLDNAGARVVDIPMIFANFHADPADASNYYFAQTDDYIKNCIELGTGIIYRLGVSIEHGFNKYFTAPPCDYEHWINICDHIIRHYTEGWAGGFNFKILYWEIWNEPEACDVDGLHLMWGGSLKEYNAFYVKVATELKKRFPHLKFGGPAHICANEPVTREFLAACSQSHAPLDFYSWHCYSQNVTDMTEQVHLVKQWLVDAGYPQTELHLNEWHYFPADWAKLRADKGYLRNVYENVIKGVDAAAFLGAVLTAWQDTPLDVGCYYTVTANHWGLFSLYSEPTKSYYGMKAFGEIIEYRDRIKTVTETEHVYALAGRNRAGEMALLVSCFGAHVDTLKIYIEGDNLIAPEQCRIEILDEEHDLEQISPVIMPTHIELPIKSESAVIVLKLNIS